MKGRIRVKKASGITDLNGKDEGVGDWIIISSPDDLFKYDVDMNFDQLNCQLLNFNVEVSYEEV